MKGSLPVVAVCAYALAWCVAMASLPVLAGLAFLTRVALTLARVR